MSITNARARIDIPGGVVAAITGHWKLLLAQGLVLEVLGLLAFTMPYLSTLAIEILIGWLFLIGGTVRLVTLARARHLPGYGWSLSASILTMAIGVLLTMNPLRGILTLTMLLMAIFVIEGICAVFAAPDYRQHTRHWVWLLFSGLIDFLLVFLLWDGWPATAAWAIGMLTGINLFILCITLVILSFAVRRPKPEAGKQRHIPAE